MLVWRKYRVEGTDSDSGAMKQGDEMTLTPGILDQNVISEHLAWVRPTDLVDCSHPEPVPVLVFQRLDPHLKSCDYCDFNYFR